MKQLTILFILVLGSCTITPKTFILYPFPSQFRGVYTKISGGNLPNSLKVSENYFMLRSHSNQVDPNAVIIYQIADIIEKSEDTIFFDIQSAYEEDDFIDLKSYRFRIMEMNIIEVTEFNYGLFFTKTTKAQYRVIP